MIDVAMLAGLTNSDPADWKAEDGSLVLYGESADGEATLTVSDDGDVTAEIGCLRMTWEENGTPLDVVIRTLARALEAADARLAEIEAPRSEVDALRAEVAELRATLAAERGELEGALPGWEWSGGRWRLSDTDGVYVVRGNEPCGWTYWTPNVWGKNRTARGAMRAAMRAVRRAAGGGA